MEEEDVWIFQKTKKNKKENLISTQSISTKKKKKKTNDNTILYDLNNDQKKKTIEEMIKIIEEICQLLENSYYFENLLSNFNRNNFKFKKNMEKNEEMNMKNVDENEEKNNDEKRIHSILSLGIGSPSHSISSLWQFCLLLVLKKYFPTFFYIYDPLMSSEDQELCTYYHINYLNFHSISENKNENYFLWSNSRILSSFLPSFPLESDEYILFYMPHCPYKLYCNVLWSFWPLLSQVLILGNSFENYSLMRGLRAKTTRKIIHSNGIEEEEKDGDLIERLMSHINKNELYYKETKIWNFFFLSSKNKLKNNNDSNIFDRLEPAFCDLK